MSDKTGASIQGVDVQLRVPETGRVLRSVGAKDGTFYLVKVRAGSCRLIVVKQEKQRVERLALADQPKLLVCFGQYFRLSAFGRNYISRYG